MVRKLYVTVRSPGCRAVLMTAKAIGLDLTEQPVDLANREHYSEHFLKLNPQHTVPTLVDDGFVIHDSHAITAYLINKYAKGSSLYPEEPEKRAIVDQRLHFDSGVVFPIVFNVATSLKTGLIKELPEDKKKQAEEAYSVLNTFLQGNNWVTGHYITIADFSLIATITNLSFFFPVNNYSNIVTWMKRCEDLPYYSPNQIGFDSFKSYYGAFLKK